MGRVAASTTHLFLVILLVSLKQLDAAIGLCPTLCRCTLEILNCSGIPNPPGLRRVPLPEPFGHPYVFFLLDFTENSISFIGKEVWRAYPWTEYLILKNNHLSRLLNTSLDGLLSLTHLDVSWNQIQIIERNTFEPVPFLQFINLSGNVIKRITQGAFQAWHGMQFLIKLVLSHNPLSAIDDECFYKLPSLKFLDLGSTEIIPKILEKLLKISLKLKTLILPRVMDCCLCIIKEDIEVLCETVRLECTHHCASNITMCGKEEPFGSMQDEVLKVLETRKLNASSMLSIVPEKPLTSNISVSLLMSHGYPYLGIHFHKLSPHLMNSVKQLNKLITDYYVDVKWSDKNELQKLYKLANLLQAALKAKIEEDEVDNPEMVFETDLPVHVLDGSADIILKTKSYLRKVKRDNRLGKYPRGKASFLRFGRVRRESAKATGRLAREQEKLASQIRAQRWRKLARNLEHQRAASFHRRHQTKFHSSQKRSIFQLPTKIPPLTASIVVDNNGQDLSGKLVIILKAANRSEKPTLINQQKVVSTQNYEVLPASTQNPEKPHQSLASNKNLLNHVMNEGSKSKIPTDDSEALNELSPDITLSHETHWEHHGQPTSAPYSLEFLPATEDYLLQGDLFQAELDKRLETLIPNKPIRNLISHVIRILKMDCTEPTIQMACAKLISRTGLLMKLFSERENIKETSALWKSYFWPAKSVPNLTTPSSRKMAKPSDEIARQGIPQYGYGNKLLLAISVTAVIMVIIAVICLIEICSQRSAKAKDGTSQEKRSFLGRRKSAPEKESSSASSLEKPLWLKDMYQPLDEIRKKDMIDKLHDEESSEEDDIFNWANARPPETLEPSEEVMDSLQPLPLAPEEAPAPAPASPEPSLPSSPPPPPPPSIAPPPSDDTGKPSTGSKKAATEVISAAELSPKVEISEGGEGGATIEGEGIEGAGPGAGAGAGAGTGGTEEGTEGGGGGGGEAEGGGTGGGDEASSKKQSEEAEEVTEEATEE